jgi:dihydropyrimidine dehydrogenase (NAD+) subunit PreA
MIAPASRWWRNDEQQTQLSIGIVSMADLRSEFLGIKSPNPFWLASAPPTDKEYNIVRAFRAGWGGVVWKTLGEDPPIVNVNGPRYGAVHGPDRRLLGFNNIELITDRPLDVNLREIKTVKRDWPDRAIVVSLMVPCEERNWVDILKKVEETGADGVELNFGCPHGMSERGMGSAVGQVPEYIEMVARWCKANTRMPVIVKLTPNITDIRYPARAAKQGGADAVSLINTVNSIIGVNLDNFAPVPEIDGKGSHGGYCGQAVKPIALNMVAEIARDPETAGLPISGIGGITTWRDAAEFMALGASNVQVCTAVMAYGFKIVQEMISGLSDWMDQKGFTSIDQFVGRSVGQIADWQYLNLNYVTKARIDQDLCIKCGRCHIACEDTSHQAITHRVNGVRHFEVIDEECVGCNLCVSVCPVEDCITMEQVHGIDPRTREPISETYANWTTHPNNPMRVPEAAE